MHFLPILVHVILVFTQGCAIYFQPHDRYAVHARSFCLPFQTLTTFTPALAQFSFQKSSFPNQSSTVSYLSPLLIGPPSHRSPAVAELVTVDFFPAPNVDPPLLLLPPKETPYHAPFLSLSATPPPMVSYVDPVRTRGASRPAPHICEDYTEPNSETRSSVLLLIP